MGIFVVQTSNLNGGLPMTSPSNSNNQNNDEPQVSDEMDWARNAEDAAKKAEAEVEKIKKEAQEQLNNSKTTYNNPADGK